MESPRKRTLNKTVDDLFVRIGESAFYFSAASYSTVGYGDLLLSETWRILDPVESVTVNIGWTVTESHSNRQRRVG